MLTAAQLEEFFVNNNIPLNDTYSLNDNQVALLVLASNDISQSLTSFILVAVINADRDGIHTNFKSYDDLYECYSAFMVGFMMVSNLENN